MFLTFAIQRRGSSGAFSSIVPSSEQAGGKVVTERTEFNSK